MQRLDAADGGRKRPWTTRRCWRKPELAPSRCLRPPRPTWGNDVAWSAQSLRGANRCPILRLYSPSGTVFHQGVAAGRDRTGWI